MGIAHTLLGVHLDGRPDYLPLVAKPRINSKLSLVAIEIEKGSELHARIMEDAKFSLNIFPVRFWIVWVLQLLCLIKTNVVTDVVSVFMENRTVSPCWRLLRSHLNAGFMKLLI